MPHRIINKLKALEAMEFPSQINTEHPYLGAGPVELPEAALDLVDGVVDDCCRIFGTRIRPNQTQLRLMAEAGYRMSFDGPTVGVQWQATVIHTQKGLIKYN